MAKLRLELLEHRGEWCIAIVGSMVSAAYEAVRVFPGRRYSKTHGCWYVIYEAETLKRLVDVLGQYQPVDVSEKFSFDRRTNPPSSLPAGYHEQLVLVRYSEPTIKTYESQLRRFMGWLKPKTLEAIDDEVIKKYLYHLANDAKVSISTQNTAINAIKFYLEKVHRGERKVYYVDRPMKEEKLPHVLTREETKALLLATKNIKHKCMLLVLYSTGLRMSELLRLRWKDFDESKLQVFVRGGKGRKDRLTITSAMTIDYLKYYIKEYKPSEYLFEGPEKGQYSPRSVNQVIHRSAELAGIAKRVSAHTLRHSFATHLLEDKTDIRYIQILMGHQSSKTTERYTHMTTRGIKGLKSPLDGLGLSLEIPSSETE